MQKTALILVILLALCVTSVYAGTTGKIAGKVRDDKGNGLAYVNISVMQNSKRISGGQSKENGTYMIINLPPGIYDLKLSLVGYATTEVSGVRINVDQTTTQNVTMSKQGIILQTYKVNATTNGVNSSVTSTEHNVNMKGMSDVAVNDVEGIVALQAGANLIGGELHVRGGRANEVNYTIDNMSVSDPVDGGNALQVDPDAISDMKVMTGGFTAEYGNAQSGVVNIITKEGDAFYSGKVEYSTDHLIGNGRNEDALKFAIGGPVNPFGSAELKDKFTFYLNGGGDWQDGRLNQYAKGDPNKDFTYKGTPLLENDYPNVDPFSSRDNFLGIDLGDRFYNSYNVNFKTKYAINELQKLTFAVRGDKQTNDFFSYLWRYAPDFNGQDETKQKQFVLSYDQVFNPQMTLKVKASYYQKNYKQGPKGIDRSNYFFYTINPDRDSIDANLEAYKDNVLLGDYGYNSVGIDTNGDGSYYYYDGYLDETLWTYRIQGVENPRSVEGFVAPGTIYTTYIDDQTSTLSTRADFEYQINDIHQAKTGFELIKHSIKKDQLFNFLTVYESRRQSYLNDIYNVDDYVNLYAGTDSVYVPSELADIVIPEDGGKPIPIYYPTDYYNAAYAASGTSDGYKANPLQAAYYLQDKMEWEGMIVNAGLRFDFWYLGSEYQVAQDNGTYRTFKFKDKDKFQMMISPRLGVSHPISDKDVLRFAYNYQNQLPQMQYIFTSKTPEDANLSTGVVVGNPNLEPQITVTYEVGLSHQVSEDYMLDMTAYYKNLYNYVSTKKVNKPGEEQVSWYEYISEDYGSTRGIDIQLEKNLSDFNSWSIAYSLAWAQGNNSSTVIQDESTNLREFPLDWDVRHNLNTSYTFRIARGEEYIVPFTNFILPLDDFSANMTWTIASGSPYTPTSGSQNTSLDTNSKRKGLTQQANLRLTKGLAMKFGPNVRLYMDIENLFKFPNIGGVFSKTGSPYWDGADLSEPDDQNFTFDERKYMHKLAIQNPANINNFRAVTFGVSFNF